MVTTSDTLPRSTLLVMTESTPIPSSTTTATDTDTVDPSTSTLATLETESGSSLEVRWKRRSLRHYTSDPTTTMDTTDTDTMEVGTETAEMVDVMTTISRSSPTTNETWIWVWEARQDTLMLPAPWPIRLPLRRLPRSSCLPLTEPTRTLPLCSTPPTTSELRSTLFPLTPPRPMPEPPTILRPLPST